MGVAILQESGRKVAAMAVKDQKLPLTASFV
jgi:hypothetical protein